MTSFFKEINPLLRLLEEGENEPVVANTDTGSAPLTPAPKIKAPTQSQIDKAAVIKQRENLKGLIDSEINQILEKDNSIPSKKSTKPFRTHGNIYKYQFDPKAELIIPSSFPTLKSYIETPSQQSLLLPTKYLDNPTFVPNFNKLKDFLSQVKSDENNRLNVMDIDFLLSNLKGWDEKELDKVVYKLSGGLVKKGFSTAHVSQQQRDKIDNEYIKLLRQIKAENQTPFPSNGEFQYEFSVLNKKTLYPLLKKKFPNLGKDIELLKVGKSISKNTEIQKFGVLLNNIETSLSLNPSISVSKFETHEVFLDGFFRVLDPTTKKEPTEAFKTKEFERGEIEKINSNLEAIDHKIKVGGSPFAGGDVDPSGYTYVIPKGIILENDFCRNYSDLKSFILTNLKDPKKPFQHKEFPNLLNTIKRLYTIFSTSKDEMVSSSALIKALSIQEEQLDIMSKEVFPSMEKQSNKLIKELESAKAIREYLEHNPNPKNNEIVEGLFTKIYMNVAKLADLDVHQEKLKKFMIFNGHDFLNNFPIGPKVKSYEDCKGTDKLVLDAYSLFAGHHVEKEGPAYIKSIFDGDKKQGFIDNFTTHFYNYAPTGQKINVFDHNGNIYFFLSGANLNKVASDVKEGIYSDDVKRFIKLIASLRYQVNIDKDVYGIELETDRIKLQAGTDSSIHEATKTRSISAQHIRIFFSLMGYPIPLYGEDFRHYLLKHIPKRFFSAIKDFFGSWGKNQYETFRKT